MGNFCASREKEPPVSFSDKSRKKLKDLYSTLANKYPEFPFK
jgi:hypothetical protein